MGSFAFLLPVWFALILSLSLLGVFEPADPPRPPIARGLAVLVPIILPVLGYTFSAGFRRRLLALDLGLLTIAQSWRIAGLTFLTLYALRLLPDLFAIPAGLGDIFVGLTAPAIATRVVSSLPARRGLFIAWTLFGMLDLIVAVSLGVISSLTPLGLVDGLRPPAVLTRLPLSLIPTFTVPLLFDLHVASLVLLRARSRPQCAPHEAVSEIVDERVRVGLDPVT